MALQLKVTLEVKMSFDNMQIIIFLKSKVEMYDFELLYKKLQYCQLLNVSKN